MATAKGCHLYAVALDEKDNAEGKQKIIVGKRCQLRLYY